MYSKFKKIASLITAVAMSFALIGAIAVAEGDSTAVTFFSTEGVADPSTYTSNAYLYSRWNAESSVVGNTASMNFSDGARTVTTMSLAQASTYLYNMHDADEAVTPIDENRYLVMPLLKVGTATPNNTNKAVFGDKIPDFENSIISFDFIKGATALVTGSKFTSIQMGLAYVDYSKSYTYQRNGQTTKQYVYATDMALIDITDEFPDYNTTRYTASKAYDDLKTEMAFSVSNIINNGTHKYINGTTNEPLSAENANAVVFNIVLNDATYYVGGNSMLINNIAITPDEASVTPTPVPTPEPVKPDGLLLWSRKGVASSTSYDADTYADKKVYVYNTWNPMSTATGTNSGNIWSSKDVFTYISLGKSVLANATAMDDAVTPSDADRYRILPLANAGAGSENKKSFSDYYSVADMEESYLKLDMIKGGGFPAIAKDGDNPYKAFKLGLAYVDYNTVSNYTSGSVRNAYATDISWIDITEEVEALNEFPANHAELDWDDYKTEVSIPMADIINNGTHKYIHGATADNPITFENANAVVIGIELENDSNPSGMMLYFDNLRIEKAVDTTFAFSGSVANGVKLSARNEGSKAITPVVVFAYYKDGLLVDVKIDKSFTVAANSEGENSYQPSSSQAFDHVAVMAFESFDTLKPLCPKFYE